VVAMAVILAMASPAFADPGNGKGFGQGQGGGDIAHSDNDKKIANGGARNNNPHNGGCQFVC
jgi:hypothetical protein